MLVTKTVYEFISKIGRVYSGDTKETIRETLENKLDQLKEQAKCFKEDLERFSKEKTRREKELDECLGNVAILEEELQNFGK